MISAKGSVTSDLSLVSFYLHRHFDPLPCLIQAYSSDSRSDMLHDEYLLRKKWLFEGRD